MLTLLERADQETDPTARSRLLTFVVAGGGFAGTEAVAELYDLTHDVLHFYPGIHPDEPHFILIHSGKRILPELSDRLGEYALGKLRARGIEFRLGVRASGCTDREVRLNDGAVIPTATFVWTAGNRPSPLLKTLPGEHGRGGSIVVDRMLRTFELEGVWAIGDCAQIPAADRPAAYPPTAQHAMREGKAVADNIAAVLKGRRPKPFRFTTIGIFVALGHRTAAGEIRGRPFSGLSAWLLGAASTWPNSRPRTPRPRPARLEPRPGLPARHRPDVPVPRRRSGRRSSRPRRPHRTVLKLWRRAVLPEPSAGSRAGSSSA